MCGCPCHQSWSSICFIDGGCCSGASIVAPPPSPPSTAKKTLGVPGSLGSRVGHCPGCSAEVEVGKMRHAALFSEIQRFTDATGIVPRAGSLWLCEDCYEFTQF